MEKEIESRFKEIEKRINNIEVTLSKSSLSKSGKLIKCVHCDHLWRTTSKAMFVSCTNCGSKTPTTEEGIKKVEKKAEKESERWSKRQEKRNKKYPTRFK